MKVFVAVVVLIILGGLLAATMIDVGDPVEKGLEVEEAVDDRFEKMYEILRDLGFDVPEDEDDVSAETVPEATDAGLLTAVAEQEAVFETASVPLANAKSHVGRRVYVLLRNGKSVAGTLDAVRSRDLAVVTVINGEVVLVMVNKGQVRDFQVETAGK